MDLLLKGAVLVWFVGFLAVVCVGYLAARPFYIERRRPPVGLQERDESNGQFIQLSQGVTHCRWAGSARGPVAIVVHGVASPMASMEAVAKGLGELGYRVLLYDLYGRGLSDAPKGKQDRAFFLRQLADLCAYHGLNEDLTIVGYSMGGGIATAFAVRYPHSVKRVVLFATSGVITNESWYSTFCRRVPLLGTWAHAMFAHRRIEKTIPERGETKELERIYRAQRRELKRRGYLPSILASRRGILAEDQEQDHRKIGRQGIPVTAVWAGKDPIIPLRAIGLLAQWNRDVHQEVVDDADHALPYTHGKQMIEALRTALRD